MNASQQTAARRYRIERYLTEGGMGAIYIGKKLGPGGFEKEVVLKQLLPEYTARPEFRDLFFREAKISATLDHAHIVHSFDLVESDESLFIVMEYVRGVDLRTIQTFLGHNAISTTMLYLQVRQQHIAAHAEKFDLLALPPKPTDV